MGRFRAHLIRRETLAENTLAFHFERPGDFAFQAGQHVVLDLRDGNAGGLNSDDAFRTFSLASRPDDAELVVVTRLRETPFKKALGALPPNTEVWLDGPEGEFTLERSNHRPAVLLAGGIGITPFFSMIQHATYDLPSKRLLLFYSNRRPEDAPFMGRLFALQKMNPRFTFIPTMTRMEKSRWKWSGERGRINIELLKKYLQRPEEAIYYIAGSPAMTQETLQWLRSGGVSEIDLRFEEFSGY